MIVETKTLRGERERARSTAAAAEAHAQPDRSAGSRAPSAGRSPLLLHESRPGAPDPADRASQEEEFSIELRTRDRERKLIKKIDKTLVRVDDNDYGFCDQCGVDIGVRRLEARPTANLCVDCKTLDEIKEKQITGG